MGAAQPVRWLKYDILPFFSVFFASKYVLIFIQDLNHYNRFFKFPLPNVAGVLKNILFFIVFHTFCLTTNLSYFWFGEGKIL